MPVLMAKKELKKMSSGQVLELVVDDKGALKDVPALLNKTGDELLNTKEEGAKVIFERLVRRFPRNEYATRARKNLRTCIIFLSEYELYVGNFYYKRGFYRAALGRFNYILQNYPDMGQYHEAIEKIRIIKEKLTVKKIED